MKKRMLLILLTGILGLTSSMTVFAAPKAMSDGAVFDVEYYVQNNPDVVAVFGTDEALLYQHYVLFGKNEGRLPVNPAEQLVTQNESVLVNKAETDKATLSSEPERKRKTYDELSDNAKDTFQRMGWTEPHYTDEAIDGGF